MIRVDRLMEKTEIIERYHPLAQVGMNYCCVNASLTPRAANMAANDRCSQTISLGELTTYLRNPFAKTPYKIKMINVIAMKAMLRISI